MAAPDSNPVSDPYIGAKAGNFKITQSLGKGGMGAVYLAEHITLNRKVAVKVLLKEAARRPNLVARFHNEAKAVAALCTEWKGFADRCNLAPVEDHGFFEQKGAPYDGMPYFILEYLEGQDLGKWLRKTQATRRYPELIDILSILVQVCCGLEVCHQTRIIHRDLSPGNIFIAPTFTNPLQVKLLDFGIARLSETPLGQGNETFSTTFLGKISYAAPEQVCASKIDARADIYALGVVAYRMLCYRAPYKPKLIEAKEEDGGGMILERTPIIHPFALRKDLPEAWGDLVMKMIAYDRNERPASVLGIAHQFAKTLPPQLGNGPEILRTVVPLLCNRQWIERSQKMLSPFILKESETVKTKRYPIQAGQPQSEKDTDHLPPGATASLSEPAHVVRTVREMAPGKVLTKPISPINLAAEPAARVQSRAPQESFPIPAPAPGPMPTPGPIPTLATPPTPIPMRTVERPRLYWPIATAAAVAVMIFVALILLSKQNPTAVTQPVLQRDAGLSARVSIDSSLPPSQTPSHPIPSSQPPPPPHHQVRLLDAGVNRPTTDSNKKIKPSVSSQASPSQEDAKTTQKPTRKNSGRLRVVVLPWATVVVDGKVRGDSPLTLSLTSGTHRIVLKGPKDRRERVRVRVEPGKTQYLSRDWESHEGMSR